MSLTSEYEVLSQPISDNEICDFGHRLERIDLLFQQNYLDQVDALPPSLQRFFMSEDEITLRLSFLQGTPCWIDRPGAYVPDTCEVLTQRLSLLATSFDLTDCECDILLAGLLPRFSDHYTMLPDSYIGEGISRRLLTRLFATSQTEFRLLQSALHPASPLFQFQLLSEEKISGNRKTGPLYRVNESLWHFFCGDGSAVTWRHPYVRWARVDTTVAYSPSLGELIFQLCLQRQEETLPAVVLEGHEHDGRERVLASILAKYDYIMLCLDVDIIAKLPDAAQRLAMAEIIREARLRRAGLMLENCNKSEILKHGFWHTMELLLQQVPVPLFILADSAGSMLQFSGLACVHLSMPQLTAEEKNGLLQAAWPAPTKTREKQILSSLVQRYPFDHADIPLLIQEADYYRRVRDAGAKLNTEDLQQTLARRSRKDFGELAQRITPVRTFDDIILSSTLKTQLREIICAIELRERVGKHFSRKNGGKIGLSALFYGDSGTGKTMAAEVLAQHLGVDLIKVDLSTVVNKYIGETEKNLSRIFDLSQTDSGVLFFDEADALFGKRAETKDARDRHANIEVSYLLQRLENYPGLVILATNNRHHLDSAFNRRFTFITRFTYPDVTLRARMWQSVWPATLSLADDVDFTRLATHTELTGANIRNVAQLAAVLSEEQKSEKVHLHHIEHAINRELAKLGRLSF